MYMLVDFIWTVGYKQYTAIQANSENFLIKKKEKQSIVLKHN